MVANESSYENMPLSTWLLDYMASHHLTFYLLHVSNTTSFLGNEGIMIGSGNEIPIISIGSSALYTSGSCSSSLHSLLLDSNSFAKFLFVQNLFLDNQVLIQFQYDSFFCQEC